MARVDVLMPQMGESIAEGTLSKWLKKVGDPVKRDEPLFEISTDKVDAEIPAPAAGTLSPCDLIGSLKYVWSNAARFGSAASLMRARTSVKSLLGVVICVLFDGRGWKASPTCIRSR